MTLYSPLLKELLQSSNKPLRSEDDMFFFGRDLLIVLNMKLIIVCIGSLSSSGRFGFVLDLDTSAVFLRF